MTKELAERLDMARVLAGSMGRITLDFFGSSDLVIDAKADGSPVTAADRAAETHALEFLETHCPGDGVLGEEHGERTGTTPWRWVIDPIDGTFSFAREVPSYGVLVGIEYQGQPVGGVIEMPALGESVWGGRDLGAWSARCGGEPQPARVSEVTSLDAACVTTTSFDYFRDAGCPDAYAVMGQACKNTRGWSDCHSHLLLATGRIDAVIEPVLARWDICAGMAVVEAAGGCCTNWQGEVDAGCRRAILSNGLLHEPLRELLSPWSHL